MSKEFKYLYTNISNFIQSQPMGYMITLLLISVMCASILSTFGMVNVSFHVFGTLINSFFWLDFIYNNFGWFILIYAIMLALSIVLKQRKQSINIHVGSLEIQESRLWQVRLIFILLITAFITLIIFDMTNVFKLRVSFTTMLIAPNALAEFIIKQMFNLIWMAFCSFAIAIIVVN